MVKRTDWSAVAERPARMRKADQERSVAFHLADTGKGGPQHVRNWLARYETVAAFAAMHGRLPRDRGDFENTERVLESWLRRQRSNEHRLSSYQRELMETLPGFLWDPRLDAWEVKCYERPRSCVSVGAGRGTQPPKLDARASLGSFSTCRTELAHERRPDELDRAREYRERLPDSDVVGLFRVRTLSSTRYIDCTCRELLRVAGENARALPQMTDPRELVSEVTCAVGERARLAISLDGFPDRLHTTPVIEIEVLDHEALVHVSLGQPADDLSRLPRASMGQRRRRARLHL